MTIETNAVRLAKIKLRSEGLHQYEIDIGSKSIDIVKICEDLNWLIERAKELEEFKQETEDRYKLWHIGAKKSLAEKEVLQAENARLREALEFYADENNHTQFRGHRVFGDVFYDRGDKARQALAGEQDG